MIKSRLDLEFIDVRLGILFSRFGVAPNTWTILTIIPSILGFLSLYYHNLPAGLVLFILAGFLDVVDGAVARVTKSVSNLGAFLDGVMDRYVEILLYIGLWFYLKDFILDASFWILLLAFGALMPSYVRAYADHRKVVVDYEDQRKMGGLLERFERLSLVYVGMLAGCFNTVWLLYAVILVAVLANLTALQRIVYVVDYSVNKRKF